MKRLLVLITTVILFSCGKGDPGCCDPPPLCCDPVRPQLIDYFSKYQVCDSVRTTTSSGSTLTVVGKGKGLDVVYSSNGTYQLFSSPPLVYNFQLASADTIYYWISPGTRQANLFRLMRVPSRNKIQYQETENSTGKFTVQYYTAEP